MVIGNVRYLDGVGNVAVWNATNLDKKPVDLVASPRAPVRTVQCGSGSRPRSPRDAHC